MNPRELFESELPMVREVISFICRRRRLFGEDAEDFGSFSILKLVDNNYAVLRKFQGRSSLRTYLTVVIERLSLDYQISKLGKWRPSARAVEMGPDAVELDTMMHRDGYSTHEAVQTLVVSKSSGLSEQSLLDVARRLPLRPRRVFEHRVTSLEATSASAAADRFVREAERAAELLRVQNALGRVLNRISAEDRLVVRLRFMEGWPPYRVASALSLPPKNLYRRIERLKKQLRKMLSKEGIDGSFDSLVS